MLAFSLYIQLIGWQLVASALKADCVRAVHACYQCGRKALAVLCRIFLACGRYKLSAAFCSEQCLRLVYAHAKGV